ncbi:tape measure protein [Brevibacterium linens]|uniref:Phage tape measure protein n=2 Tax=Bacteria TaxID=2 RepID=A0A0B9A5N7_BRELN|nr:tape measure protein [Brevibacterium linens]KHS54181.1 phage tape measure protein [Brevibacterium linens]
MADRTLVVSIRAEAAQFRTAMNEAAASADKAGAAAEGAGRKVQSSAQQVEAAGRKVSDARRQEMDAAARLNTAEKKLDEVKRNGKATASQVAQAEERVITSRNRLEKATETLGAAEKTHSQAMQVSAQRAGQSTSKLQELAKQADANREAWTTAGTALSIFGGTIIGVGVAAGKAGVEFNTLKQTSGAALKTVTGSAEAAQRQMDKLNQFGSKSWVMRDVLIRSQQAMAGFGVETRKIIPYLDGLQEAVAAAGGSSQTFEELAGVMAKVKSQGKITAETFNEFGTRGVDAATIIGEQMGKTGQEIRDSVTKGSLDADVALDALAEGMKTKFDGATENLRNTFRGAMDNLSAAWRDFSSEMASPIVDPDGGGLGVSALNALADAMVSLKDVAAGVPDPVKAVGLAVGGTVGAASLAAGGFLALAPRIVETQKAFATLAGQDDLVGKTARGLGRMQAPLAAIAKVGGVVTVLAGVATALGKIAEAKSLEEAEKATRGLARAMEDVQKSSGALDKVFQTSDGGALTSDIDSLSAALERTFHRNWEERFNDWGEGIIQNFTSLRGESGLLEDQFSALDAELARMVEGGNAAGATASFEAIKAQADELDISVEDLITLFPEYQGALEDANLASRDAAGGMSTMSEEAIAAQEHLEEVRKGLVDGANGFLDFTAKAKESKTTLQEWITDMEKQVEAQAQWMDNLARLAERGAPQELLDQLMSMGPEGARMVKKLADGSDEDMQRVIDVFKDSKKNVNEFANSVAGIPTIDLDADPSKLREQIKDSKGRLAELEKMPTSPEISAQITLLKEKIKEAESKLAEVENGKTTAKVDADTSEAKKDVNGFKSWFKDNSKVTMSVWAKIKETFTSDGKTSTKTDSKGNTSRNPMGRATGGPISGPGSGTSDSIPTMLSNGEHVWTAYEVQRAGGHGAIEAMRRAVVSGQRLAKGGPVGIAQKRVDSAETELRRARRQKSAAKSKTSKAQADRRIWSAEDELEAARKSLKSAKDKAKADEKAAKIAAQQAKEAKRIAEQKAKEERERKARVNDLRTDLRVDLRRGNIRDQVTGGLSGGYSAVDRLYDLGSNQDLSRGSRSRANSSARKFEANLRSLYAQAERIDERLKKAQDKAQELKGIKDTVVSSLLGGRDLDVGTYQTRVNGQWQSQSNLGQAAKGLRMDVGAMKAFAGKLKKLTELGIPGAIIQEIAQAGVEEGSNMADSFIGATAAERKSYLGAWSDYEKYANQAGQYVTEGFYKGGSAAADGVVKGLEGKQKNVEAAIANLAKTMESTFKQVLGIHSPSRVMSELGGFTAEGLVQGMLGGVSDVQSAAAALGSAAVPNMMAFQPTDVSMDVGVNPVMADDEGMAGLAMQDMSDTTLTAMEQMNLSVSEGFAGMLANIQAAQAGMLLSTQESQLGMLTSTQTQNAAMLLDTQTQQAAMLLNTQTHYEGMRSTAESKQIAQRTVMTDQQELMRLMLIDKQSQMKSRSATDFEELKNTTGTKFSDMRKNTDTTMSGMYGDYDTRLADLKGLNRRGFESILSTSNANMEGVRKGINAEMEDAKPQLGNRMNALIGVLSSFTASVNKAFKDVGVDLKAPAPLKFATGGVMPGYTPGRDVHQFYSPTAGNLHLSGGEAIMRPEWTRAMGGEAGVKAQNDAARQGRLDDLLHAQSQAFASGGVFGRIPGVNAFADAGVWRNLWAITRDQFPNARLTSAYRGGSRTVSGNASYHSRGMAIDVSPSMDIFNFWRNKYGANLAELIYSPANGKQIKNGSNHYYTGAVRGMHFNHVHIAARQALSDAMAGGLPGMGGEMSHPFLDRAGVTAGSDLQASYAKAAEKLTQQIYAKHAKQLPDGIAGQLGKGIMSQVSEGLVGKAKEYGKTTAISGTTAGDPAVKAAVRKIAEQMGWGKYWGDIDWLVNKESSWNPNAANPSSSARGLFQKMTSLHGPVEDTVEGQARWGLNYIKSTYGDPAKARAHHQRSNWYEGGTERAKRGLAVVGEEGPELVNFQGGEQVLSTVDSMKFMAANRTYIPTSGPQFDQAAFTNAVAGAVQANGINPNDLADALSNMRITFNADGQQFTGAVTAVVGSGYDQSRSRLSKSSQKIGAR